MELIPGFDSLHTKQHYHRTKLQFSYTYRKNDLSSEQDCSNALVASKNLVFRGVEIHTRPSKKIESSKEKNQYGNNKI